MQCNPTLPIGCGQAFCASQQQSLDFSCWCPLFWRFISFGLIASQLLLETARCIPLPLQSVSSHLISSHAARFSSHFISSPLISPHLISCLALLSLLSADHYCSHLFLCHPSFSHFLSAHLNSSLFSFSQLLHSTQLVATQLFTALRMSGRLSSSHLISSQLISALSSSATLLSPSQLVSASVMSSHLFPPLLTSSKLFSTLLTSSQLSHLISTLLRPKTRSKTGWITAPKPQKRTVLKAFYKQIWPWKAPTASPKLIVATLAQPFQCDLPAGTCERPWNYVRNSNIEQQRRSHPNAFASSALQKTIQLHVQQQRRATLMQPLQYDLQAASCKRQWKYVRGSNTEQLWCRHSNGICKHQLAEANRITLARLKLLLAKTCSKTGSRRQSRKKYEFDAIFFEKRIAQWKMKSAKNEKNNEKPKKTHCRNLFAIEP